VKEIIYLDHAAATPISKGVLAAMQPYFSERFFNPSSPYLPAVGVRQDYERAKDDIAQAIGAKGSELIITAGATESINLAFQIIPQCCHDIVFSAPSAWSKRSDPRSIPMPKGGDPTSWSAPLASSALKMKQKKDVVRTDCCTITPKALTRSPSFTSRAEIDQLAIQQPAVVLTSAIEHPAVLEAAKRCGNYDTVAVNGRGLVDLDDLKAKLTDSIVLISVQLVNNELGTIQPISDIAHLVKNERANRLKAGNTTPLYLHCDASQGFGLLDVNVARLGVDMLTLNSGKVYGPKQVGALYVGRQVKLDPLIVGGGQEQGMRAGTQNVAGVVGFAKAVKDAKKHVLGEQKRLGELKTALKHDLAANISFVEFLGDPKKQLNSFVPITLPGLDAERLIFILEESGVLVATGSACAASKGTKSHVLKAIGLTDKQIDGSLRLTMGKLNTPANTKKAAELIIQAVNTECERLGL